MNRTTLSLHTQSTTGPRKRRAGRPALDVQACRQGVAAVEFALVLPLFMVLILGIAEFGRALNVSTNLTAAIREGGRLASMHHNGVIPDGVSASQKVLQDIRNVIMANGINADQIELSLTHGPGPREGMPFDLSDSDNYLEYFQIRATVPYSAVSLFPLRHLNAAQLNSTIVFRLGRGGLND